MKGVPMVTFQGDPKEAAVLLPERTFRAYITKGGDRRNEHVKAEPWVDRYQA